jgi:glutathione S-transferase
VVQSHLAVGQHSVLKVDEKVIFESAVIVEYLEETQRNPLHPRDPLRRAEHRSWMEFASAALNQIAGPLCCAGRNRIHWKSEGAV